MNRLVISIFLFSGVLLGCGQKGDLYIPQEPLEQGSVQVPAAQQPAVQESTPQPSQEPSLESSQQSSKKQSE